MDEIIQLVCDKTGISADQARTAVETVVGFVKDKLPGGMGEQVESFINGGSSLGDLGNLGGMAGSLTDKIGGMLGN